METMPQGEAPKKYLRLYNNWLHIMIPCASSKVLTRISHKRLKDDVDECQHRTSCMHRTHILEGCEGRTSKVIHNEKLTEASKVQAEVRYKEGCLPPPMTFQIAVYWIMQETRNSAIGRIQCTVTQCLEYFYYADNLCLMLQISKTSRI